MWPNRVWPKNLPPATYLVLSVNVIFCLSFLVLAVDAGEAKATGLFFWGRSLSLLDSPPGRLVDVQNRPFFSFSQGVGGVWTGRRAGLLPGFGSCHVSYGLRLPSAIYFLKWSTVNSGTGRRLLS